jgi:hypothetical protein
MSSTRSHSLSRLLIVALFVVGRMSVGLSAGQSLADVAKKEDERRKTVPAPAKVYTNKDLSPSPAGSQPGAPPAKAADDAKPVDGDLKGGSAKAGAGNAKDGAKAVDGDDKTVIKDEKYWAGRLKTLRDDLARDENYADAMQTRINALTTDFVNRDDPAQRAVIEQNRQKSIAELARLTKSVQDSKKAIDDLLEAARRAGVPPGWVR